MIFVSLNKFESEKKTLRSSFICFFALSSSIILNDFFCLFIENNINIYINSNTNIKFSTNYKYK